MRNTILMMFVAVVLITNSHLDSLYPIPEVGIGGAIGNAIFFFLAGFGLKISFDSNPKMEFPSWYGKRLMRIYPSVFIVTLVFLFLFPVIKTDFSISDILKIFIWPTEFWFVSAIMIYYAAFFVILKKIKSELFGVFILALYVPYFAFYLSLDLGSYVIEGSGYFKWLHYFQIFLFGAYFVRFKELKKFEFRSALFFSSSLFSIYYLIKYCIVKYNWLEFQFVTHLILFPFLYFLYFALTNETVLKVAKFPLVGTVIVVIAEHALEIYLLQFYIYSAEFIKSLTFPFNVLSFIFIVIIAAIFVKKLNKFPKIVTMLTQR